MPLSVSLPPSASSSLLLPLLLLILWHGNLSGLIYYLFPSCATCSFLMLWPCCCCCCCVWRSSFPNTNKGSAMLTQGTTTPGIQAHVSENAYVTCQRQKRRHSFRALQLQWQFYSPNISMSIQLLRVFSTHILLHSTGVNGRKTKSSTVLVHNIESKYCVYREQKIVSNLTRYDVQYSFKHLITFALSQAKSRLEMSRWHVPCWPSNWTTSWVENPSSTDTFRDTKPQSSLLSLPEGSATRWGSLISFTAFIYCKNIKRLH